MDSSRNRNSFALYLATAGSAGLLAAMIAGSSPAAATRAESYGALPDTRQSPSSNVHIMETNRQSLAHDNATASDAEGDNAESDSSTQTNK